MARRKPEITSATRRREGRRHEALLPARAWRRPPLRPFARHNSTRVTAPFLDLRLFLSSPLFEGTSFVLGLVVGSFANVCIHRLPLGRSIVSPPSRCPACGSLIAPRDNVPVLGWLWLRGRCRSCSAPISMRYPAVELLNGLLYLGLALLFGPSGATLLKMALSTSLLVLALIDLEHQILPDAITLPGLVLGLAGGGPCRGRARRVPRGPGRVWPRRPSWACSRTGTAGTAAATDRFWPTTPSCRP